MATMGGKMTENVDIKFFADQIAENMRLIRNAQKELVELQIARKRLQDNLRDTVGEWWVE